MNLLDRLCGDAGDSARRNASEKPDLDPLCKAGRSVKALSAPLLELAVAEGDAIEIVPSEQQAYVYIGHPPQQFRFAWVHDDHVERLDELLAEHGYDDDESRALIARLRDLYRHHKKDVRYCAEVRNHSLVVLPSNAFSLDLHDLLEEVVHH